MYSSTARVQSASIISSAAGTIPSAMIALTVAVPSSTALEVEQHRAHRGWRLGQLDADLGGDAEHALAADERAPQVEAARLGVLAADDDDLALREHDLEAEDVRAT